MKRIYSLFVNLFKNYIRSKSGVFFSILFPVMLLLIFSAVFGGPGDVDYSLHVEDNDVLFEMDLSEYEESLREGNIDEELRQEFNKSGFQVSENAVMERHNGDWQINENGEISYHLLEKEDRIEVYGLSRTFIDTLDATQNLDVEVVDNLTEYREESGEFEEHRGLMIEEGFNSNAINKSMQLRMAVMQDTMFRIYRQRGDRMEEDERANFTEGWESLNETTDETERPSANITLYTNPGDQGAAVVSGTVRGVMDTFNSHMVGIEDNIIEMEDKDIAEDEGLEPVDYYLPGFIAAFIMTNGIISLTANISEFKRNGTLKRLTATPLKKRDWILANIAHQGLLAFLLTGVMILVAVLVYDAQAFIDPYSIGLIFLGSVAFCSVGIVLGGLIKDVEAASGAGNAIAFPMMFLSGAFIPIEQFPSYLQTVARFLPLYYFHQGLREIMIYQNPGEAVIAFVVIGIFALIFVILAIKTTKWKDL